MNNSKEKKDQLILFQKPSELVRIGNSVAIVNRLLNQDISDLFNQGFCKLNSKKIKSVDRDYLFELEHSSNSQILKNFDFQADKPSDYQKAIDLLMRVLEIKPSHSLTLTLIGICYWSWSNGPEADDSDPEYDWLGKPWDEALKFFTKGIEADSYNALAMYFSAVTWKYYWVSREVIIDYASKALELDENFADAYFTRGEAKVRHKDFEGALSDLIAAIDLDNSHSFWFYTRGDCRFLLRSYNDALEDFKSGLELDNLDIKNNKKNHVIAYDIQKYFLDRLLWDDDENDIEFYKEVCKLFPHI
jgi:tetratricopeptide (TPR) repeat protein